MEINITGLLIWEQDKSSDIEQQPPFGDRKISNIQLKIGGWGWGLQNQQEHHIILTKYEAVHPSVTKYFIRKVTHVSMSLCLSKYRK